MCAHTVQCTIPGLFFLSPLPFANVKSMCWVPEGLAGAQVAWITCDGRGTLNWVHMIREEAPGYPRYPFYLQHDMQYLKINNKEGSVRYMY